MAVEAAVRRQERGSLFARLRLGGEPSRRESNSPKPLGGTPGGVQVFGHYGSRGSSAHGSALAMGGITAQRSGGSQQLDAMTEQLEAVTACMRDEQQARVAAEAELVGVREQLSQVMRHLGETERKRKEEASTLAALRGLLEQLQGENSGLKEQNNHLVAQLRPFVSARD